MENFTKILHPFDEKFYPDERYRPTFIKITTERGYLSITGVQAPKTNGNAWGGCGQIDMYYDHADKMENDSRNKYLVTVDQLKFSKGWNAAMWYELLHLWKMWHLKNTIPDGVLGYLKNLPDTTRKPNWI